jgi:hypothetical protein
MYCNGTTQWSLDALNDFIYLVICDLFNDIVSSSDYVVLDDRLINEMENIWKEVVMA